MHEMIMLWCTVADGPAVRNMLWQICQLPQGYILSLKTFQYSMVHDKIWDLKKKSKEGVHRLGPKWGENRPLQTNHLFIVLTSLGPEVSRMDLKLNNEWSSKGVVHIWKAKDHLYWFSALFWEFESGQISPNQWTGPSYVLRGDRERDQHC